MLRSSRAIAQAAPWRSASICCSCAARPITLQRRAFSATERLSKRLKSTEVLKDIKHDGMVKNGLLEPDEPIEDAHEDGKGDTEKSSSRKEKQEQPPPETMSLREALLGGSKKKKSERAKLNFDIKQVAAEDFHFEPVDIKMPPVPKLAYGLDRVLFNPGVYRLQDPRTGIYNFDPYLEKIMPAEEFDFDALSEYKTSSLDEDLLAVTRRLGVKYTGSTSSMSGVLQHFHFLLSAHRRIDHSMLSKKFPDPSNKYSRITAGPDAIFLRYKDGVYAMDADKTYDAPNIMSWLGHSMEKLLTTERTEFERYRRSSPEQSPSEADSARCFHYSKQGNVLVRSQLDAQDPRLPGAGIFDLKTRAVVSIRMNHRSYEQGLGYQLRYAQGEWESFEREYYDMTRATMLKYSLQVRMGRMDGIFLAYHNIERIFGFQYLSLADMDQALHGQSDTCLGDQEFRLSIGLMEELLNKATEKFPDTSLRLHFETRDSKHPFMYVFAEPVTEERADEIQNTGTQYAREWARRVVGVGKNDAEAKEAWQDLQEEIDEQVSEDGTANKGSEAAAESPEVEASSESESTIENETAAEESESETATEEHESETATGESGDTLAPPQWTKDTTSEGPLVGWTVTVRNKVNGQYVTRPEDLEPLDNWQIEYNIQEIAEDAVWKNYSSTKERRRNLVGQTDENADKALANYRKVIQRYASRGRQWRAEQDQINQERGTQLYKPLGPGSPEYTEGRGKESASVNASEAASSVPSKSVVE